MEIQSGSIVLPCKHRRLKEQIQEIREMLNIHYETAIVLKMALTSERRSIIWSSGNWKTLLQSGCSKYMLRLSGWGIGIGSDVRW